MILREGFTGWLESLHVTVRGAESVKLNVGHRQGFSVIQDKWSSDCDFQCGN